MQNWDSFLENNGHENDHIPDKCLDQLVKHQWSAVYHSSS